MLDSLIYFIAYILRSFGLTSEWLNESFEHQRRQKPSTYTDKMSSIDIDRGLREDHPRPFTPSTQRKGGKVYGIHFRLFLFDSVVR